MTAGPCRVAISLCGVIAASLLGCSRHHVEASLQTTWPAPSELVRVELVPGVSVLAPFASFEQGDVQKPWGLVYCKRLEPLKNNYRPSQGCVWDGFSTSRSLAMGWYPHAIPEGLPPEEQLGEMQRLFQLESGSSTTLSPVKGKWAGWEWTSTGEGGTERIRDRFIAIEGGVVFLQAVSVRRDAFPEAELFFESLAVDPAAQTAQPSSAR